MELFVGVLYVCELIRVEIRRFCCVHRRGPRRDGRRRYITAYAFVPAIAPSVKAQCKQLSTAHDAILYEMSTKLRRYRFKWLKIRIRFVSRQLETGSIGCWRLANHIIVYRVLSSQIDRANRNA